MDFQEDNFWTAVHKKWNLYPSNTNLLYQIIEFDDGNDKYRNYVNQWFIYGDWKEKVALINKFDNDIRIGSISLWKIQLIENMVEYFDYEPSLDDQQSIVGGYITPIHLQDGRIMMVNEEGDLHKLPMNEEASSLAHQRVVGRAVVYPSPYSE